MSLDYDDEEGGVVGGTERRPWEDPVWNDPHAEDNPDTTTSPTRLLILFDGTLSEAKRISRDSASVVTAYR